MSLEAPESQLPKSAIIAAPKHLGQLIRNIKIQSDGDLSSKEIDARERLIYACNPLIPTLIGADEPGFGALLVAMAYFMQNGVQPDKEINILNLREKIYLNRPRMRALDPFVVKLGNLAFNYFQVSDELSQPLELEFAFRETCYARDPLLPDYLNMHRLAKVKKP